MPIGYRPLPTSDATELKLRNRWHETRDAWRSEGFPTSSMNQKAHEHADDALTAYLWQRCEVSIALDRQKHPKARRNQPAISIGGHGRYLP